MIDWSHTEGIGFEWEESGCALSVYQTAPGAPWCWRIRLCGSMNDLATGSAQTSRAAQICAEAVLRDWLRCVLAALGTP